MKSKLKQLLKHHPRLFRFSKTIYHQYKKIKQKKCINLSGLTTLSADEYLAQTNYKFARMPLISILVPTYNTKLLWLRQLFESVAKQTYVNWELCIVDDASTNNKHLALIVEYARLDPRIKYKFLDKNQGIAAATNEALGMSNGEYIALVDHDDLLTPNALFENILVINEYPDVDVIYSDECKISETGKLSEPFFKPNWSPELLLNCMYVGHLTLYSRHIINIIGEFKSEYDYSQDYDYMLRATEKARKIYHIKKVLYLWRQAIGSAACGGKQFARETNIAALSAALKRRNIDAHVVPLETANRVKLKLDTDIKVSVIIPSDSYENLSATIDNIIKYTDYPTFELVLVTNSDVALQIKTQFVALESRLNVAIYDKPYNFSDKCNIGAHYATGEIIIFYNDDVRTAHADWIQVLIEYLNLDGIGGVSPKLFYENKTIQYAGMVTGVRNLIGTAFRACHKDSNEYFNYIQLVRNVSILSGACLAMRKSVFEEIGGFDANNTPIMGSDVDLSFKLIDAGYRCVYTPYAELLHIGHLSLSEYEQKAENHAKLDKSDIYLLKKWNKFLGSDPYFTTSMKQYLYSDSVEQFMLYPAYMKATQRTSLDVLLVSHELTYTGAVKMLVIASEVMIKCGYFVTIIAPTDGDARAVLNRLGVCVIVDELLFKENDAVNRLGRNFDLVIVNTILSWSIVSTLQRQTKVIWWIHEAKLIAEFIQSSNQHKKIMNALKISQHILVPSEYSKKYVSCYSSNVEVISNGVSLPPVETNDNHTPHKMTFVIAGSIDKRKGSDVLIAAIKLLQNQKLLKGKVIAIGQVLDQQIKSELDAFGDSVFEYRGNLSFDDALRCIAAADVLICPSRDDPFPLVVLEALAFGKPVIVSDSVGVTDFLENGKHGYISKTGDAKSLAAAIHQVLRLSQVQLQQIGKCNKTLYHDFLTVSKFQENFIRYVQVVLS